MRRHRTSLMFLLIRPPLGWWLRWRFRLSIHYDASMDGVRPPFLLLANHVNYWDPFLLVLAFRRPVHFLAADGNFRSRLMRFLMHAAGAIPKAKARTDIESLRDLQRRIAEHEIVALFPEGQRTWDGASRAMLPATPKLARLLGAPVVAVQLRGAYLSTPRWARNLRRGRLELHVSRILSRTELRTLPRSRIAERLARALTFDEASWQEKHGIRFVGRNRACHAEQAVFWCPACGSWDTFSSHGNELTCADCAYRVWFGGSGRLLAVGPSALPGVFRMRDWNARQLNELEQQLFDAAHGPPGPLPLRTAPLKHLIGYRSRPLRPRGTVVLELDRRDLRLSSGLQVPVAEIDGINVQFAHQLEFYAGGVLHVLRADVTGSALQHASVYRVEQTVLMLQDLYKVAKH